MTHGMRRIAGLMAVAALSSAAIACDADDDEPVITPPETNPGPMSPQDPAEGPARVIPQPTRPEDNEPVAPPPIGPDPHDIRDD